MERVPFSFQFAKPLHLRIYSFGNTKLSEDVQLKFLRHLGQLCRAERMKMI